MNGIEFPYHFLADSAEDAEEMVETACEKASASFPEMSYEGIEDIEEEEEE